MPLNQSGSNARIQVEVNDYGDRTIIDPTNANVHYHYAYGEFND